MTRATPALHTLQSLVLSRDEMLELGGLRCAPDLLDPRGDRALHVLFAGGAAIAVALVALFVQASACRWPLGTLLVTGLVALVLIELDAETPAKIVAAGLLAPASWFVVRCFALTAGVWAWTMGLAAIAGAAVWAVARTLRSRRREAQGLAALARLHEAVDRFNDLVSAADVACRLDPSSGGVLPADDLAALVHGRQELVRALMTERLLREHGPLLDAVDRHGELALATTHLAAGPDVGATRAARVLDTLSIAARVQEELAKLPERPRPRR